MPQYFVRYSTRAEDDLEESYLWGLEFWGRDQADEWIKRTDELIKKRLSCMPLACPLAPESEDFDFEIRQLVLSRYRILFRIVDMKILILRIRGPFSGQIFGLE